MLYSMAHNRLVCLVNLVSGGKSIVDKNQVQEISELLQSQGKMSFPDGASEENIESFEKSNNIKFPAQYREWLLFADGGNLFLPAGLQLYGVKHKPIINLDEKDKPDENYVVAGRMSWGEPIVFKKGSEEFAIYDHETGEIDDEVRYDGFFDFLKGLYDLLGIGE